MEASKSHKLAEKSERKSGIELLKVAAILLIVLSHTVQTLHWENPYINYRDYVLNLTMATTNLQHLMLAIFQYSGQLGNSIFFVCSTWFLLDRREGRKEKVWFMLLEIWTISIVILVVVYILRAGSIDTKMLLKSLFPTTFSLNWYMTCYLIFYLIHPVLNEIIRKMTQKTLIKASSLLLMLYVGVDFIIPGYFFSSSLIIWVAVYFAAAYMKLYLKDFASSTAANICLLLATLAGQIGIILITNFLGLRISFFADKLLYWNTPHNPFLYLIAIAALNLAQKVHWQNSFVNHISKLSMLVYIIHENIILATYYRPYFVNYI